MAKRLILLSGKGGVGKTTMAVALGLLAARLKKKTLILEMNSTERVAPYFGLKEIGHREVPLSPYISGININPHDCFEEYVLMQIRFRAIYETFINNRFVTAFLNAVPGFNELLMIGKIYDLERQAKRMLSREKLYDLIIVDGPATGHGVSAFEVPQVVHEMVHVGPLRSQSENILKLVNDPKKTAFSAVTLPEEMPMVECSELLSMIRKRLGIGLGPVFINNIKPSPFENSEEEKILARSTSDEDPLYPYFSATRLTIDQGRRQEEEILSFKKENPAIDTVAVAHLEEPPTSHTDLEPIVSEWLKDF